MASLPSESFQEPRLFKLLLPFEENEINNIQNLNDVLLFFSHWLLWNISNTFIYGGFVRDWIILGQPANDIDCYIPDDLDPNTLIPLISKIPNFNIISAQQKGKPFIIKINTNWGDISCDLVKISTIYSSPAPHVDADVNNLKISRFGIETKVPKVGSNEYKISECINHIKKKEFVFFMNINTNKQDYYILRLKKLLDKKFTCLSPLPSNIDLESKYNRYLAPIKRYDIKWWE